MDATIRNLDAGSFRRFKAKCAQENETMGDALCVLMDAWSSGKLKIPSIKGPRGPKPHVLKDLSEHLHTLHQWNELAHASKPRRRDRK